MVLPIHFTRYQLDYRGILQRSCLALRSSSIFLIPSIATATDLHCACDTVYQKLHCEGVGTTVSTFMPEKEEMLRAKGVISILNPKAQQRAVFFYVTKHFYIKGGQHRTNIPLFTCILCQHSLVIEMIIALQGNMYITHHFLLLAVYFLENSFESMASHDTKYIPYLTCRLCMITDSQNITSQLDQLHISC